MSFEENKECLLATASKEGVSSIGYRGSMFVWNGDHLAFWERSHQFGLRHMQENPNVCVLYVDRGRRVGWRFYGQATLYKQGEIRQKIMDGTIQDELDKDPERTGFGVLIRIDLIKRFSGEDIVQKR